MLLSNKSLSNLRLDGLGTTIKNIQTGLTDLAGQSTTQNIDEIDVASSVVFRSKSVNVSNNTYNMVTAKITDSTTLTFERGTTSATNPAHIRWIVMEFNNVKSRQSGSQSMSGGSFDATYEGVREDISINAVDLNKSWPVATVRTTADSDLFNDAAWLSSSTGLSVVTNNTADTVEWQIIEFK